METMDKKTIIAGLLKEAEYLANKIKADIQEASCFLEEAYTSNRIVGGIAHLPTAIEGLNKIVGSMLVIHASRP